MVEAEARPRHDVARMCYIWTMTKPRKPDREPLRPIENRDVTRSIRMTESEAEMVRQAAELQRMRPSEFMRAAILTRSRSALRKAGRLS